MISHDPQIFCKSQTSELNGDVERYLESSVVTLISATSPTGLIVLLGSLQEGGQFQELPSYHYSFHSIDVGNYVEFCQLSHTPILTVHSGTGKIIIRSIHRIHCQMYMD